MNRNLIVNGMKMKVFLRVVLLIGLIGGVGCGDDTAGDDFDDRANPTPTAPRETEPKEPEVEALVLEAVGEAPTVVGETQFTVEIRETVNLNVFLQTETSHEGVAGEVIDFTVLQAPDNTFSIADDSVETDAEGVAKTSLSVGEKPGLIVVRASYPGTTPVEFQINITNLADGAMQVEIFPPAGVPVTLAPYRVRAYDAATVTCAGLPPRADSAGFDLSATAAGELVTLQNAIAEKTYTVMVQGLGSSLNPLASGCVDNVYIESRETTIVQVPVQLISLTPTGTYLVNGLWDIEEAIASSSDAASMLVDLINFMANPGQFIYDLLMVELEAAVGSSVVVLLDAAGVPTLVEDAINDFIFQDQDLLRYREIAVALDSMLNTLRVESELVIAKTDMDTFIGYEHWQKVTLNLDWRCDTVANPGCGDYELSMDQDGNLPGLGAVHYDWTGRIYDYNHLTIEGHEMTIEYGALLVTIIEQVVIPELTNGQANTFEGAFNYWVDCNGLAQNIVGSLPIGQGAVEQACLDAMADAADYVTAPLLNQNTAFLLDLAGTAMLRDTTSNNWVDEMYDGVHTGTMVDTGAPVSVEWSAVRVEP